MRVKGRYNGALIATAALPLLDLHSPGVLEGPGRLSLPWVQQGPNKGINKVKEGSRDQTQDQGHERVKLISWQKRGISPLRQGM